MRPGVIRYFMVHSVQIEGNQISHAFAVVNWPRPSEQDFGYGNPFSVWLKNFEEAGPSVLLPVKRLHKKYLYAD